MGQVVWGTDEEGRLIPVSTTEKKMEDKTIAVTCPEGVSPGQAVQIETDGQKFQVTVPEGVTPGQTFNAAVKVAAKTGATVLSTETAAFKKLTVDEVNQRVKNLQTSFAAQSNALFRKNLTFQGKRRCTNCCLLLVPIFLTVLVLLLQLLIEVLFLGRNFVRCPYCGPADDFAKTYCANKDCADFFFYDNTTATGRQQRADIENLFEKDVHTECRDLMKTCGGNGNTECFLSQYASGFQFGFCPFTIGPKNPDLRQAPAPTFRSSTPVLFTGGDEVRLAHCAHDTRIIGFRAPSHPFFRCCLPESFANAQESFACRLFQRMWSKSFIPKPTIPSLNTREWRKRCGSCASWLAS
jgi:hypothetical protein